MDWKALTDLLQSGVYWWVVPIAITIYAAEKFELPQLPRWLVNRRNEKLSFVKEELKETDGLDPEMRTHLKCKRDRLLLQITEGITVDAYMGGKLIAISEDQPGGIKWSTLALAQSHLITDDQGQLSVCVKRFDWIFGRLMLIPAALCAISYCYLGVIVALGASMLVTNVAVSGVDVVRNIVLAILSLTGYILFRYPNEQIRAAHRVGQHLRKIEEDGPTSSKASSTDSIVALIREGS